MKLHLPIALLVAVSSAQMTTSYAATNYKYVTNEGEVVSTNPGEDKTKATFEYSYNDVTGTMTSGFVGDLSSYFGYNKEPKLMGESPHYNNHWSSTASVSAMQSEHSSHTAENTVFTIGDDKGTVTKVLYASGAGVNGDCVKGNKTVTVKDGASVEYLVGGAFVRSKCTYKSCSTDSSLKKVGSYSYCPSTSASTITIKIEKGAKVGELYGSNFFDGNAASGATADSEGYTNLVGHEKVVIEVAGGTVGTIIAGFHGAIDNSVGITLKDGATVLNDVYGGSCSYQNRNAKSYVGSVGILIEGEDTKVLGSVYGGGGMENNATTLGSDVKGTTTITLKGGAVEKSVYGAGDHGSVGQGTEIIIEGDGTQVKDTIYGGGTNGATVTGDRKLTVTEDHDSTSREEGYKLADFTMVNVDGDIKVESLEGAKDDKGNVTEVTVGEEGSISTKAGALSNLKSLKVKGALTIDMSDAAANESGVTGDDLSLDGATINVVATGAGASDSISVFAFDTSNEDAGNFTLTLNGSAVDDELWGFEDGVLFIKEASTTTLNLNRNQSRFHDALCAMQEDGKATPELAALATSRDADEVKAGLDALSGHEYATAMSSQIEGNLGHLRRLKGAMGKGDMLGRDAKTGAAGDRWRAGVSVFHEETELDSDARGDGYDRSETGAMLTAEYFMRENLTVGGALSYGRTRLSPDGARSRHEDNTRLDVYALYGKKRWSFATSLGLGIHEHELPGGDADGYSVNFMQDAACTLLHREKDNVQVFGTVESSWNNIDSFSGGMVSGGSQDAWATDVTVGLRYNRALRPIGFAPAGVFTVQTGVTASIGDVKSGIDMSINGYGYRQESATRNRWGWSIGAGVDVPLRHNVSVFGVVDAVMRGDSSSVDGQIGVKVSF